MTLSFTDPEKWDEQYEHASRKQRYEMVLETIEQPLSKEFIEKLDLGMCLLDTKGDLLANNLLPEFLDFIQKLQEKQPEFYKKEFYYYDGSLVTYYLFQDEPEKVAESLSRFMENPASGIDDLIPVLDKLIYYGSIDLAEKLSLKAYMPVAKAPGLIGGAEWDFVHLLFVNMIHNAYCKIRNGEEVDWKAFMKKAGKYGFHNDQDMLDGLQRGLTQEMGGGSEFVIKTKKQKQEKLDALTWEFCRYMFEQKQMDFVCSEHIWDQMLRFWEEKNGSRKSSSSPKVFFNFSKPVLDQHLAQMAGGLMSQQQSNAVGLLWGIPYIYDFLLARDIIPKHVHKEVMSHVNKLKPEMIKAFRNGLWEYDFVHRWTSPDSVSEKEFSAESEHFKAAIKIRSPLSEKPTDMMAEMMGMFKDALMG